MESIKIFTASGSGEYPGRSMSDNLERWIKTFSYGISIVDMKVASSDAAHILAVHYKVNDISL